MTHKPVSGQRWQLFPLSLWYFLPCTQLVEFELQTLQKDDPLLLKGGGKQVLFSTNIRAQHYTHPTQVLRHCTVTHSSIRRLFMKGACKSVCRRIEACRSLKSSI